MKYHQKKTLILQCLDKLPGSLGYFIYHKLQQNALKNINAKLQANKASLKQLEKVLNKYNIQLKDRDILEIGSGWFPILPFLFKTELNVNKIITYDINEHYSKKSVNAAKALFNSLNIEKISSRFGLPEFVDYHPNTNFINAPVSETISFVFSRFVLEHVKPDDIYLVHKKIHEELKDDVKVFHHISPSDHRAYTDKSISYYDFLKYSKAEWDNIQTKFDYHNRLRLPEYLDIFEKAGFKITYLDHDHVDKKSAKYKKFKELKLHSDYKNFTEKEILAGSIFVLLEKA